jgi:DNA-binding MarR family transcriptional regulator
MIDLTKAKEDAEEALGNIGKLSVRIGTDEGKRLTMLTSTVTKYIKQLEERVCEFNND